MSTGCNGLVSPLHQSHAAEAAEDFTDADVLAQCTQTPTTRVRKGSKRLRKHEHLITFADGGNSTPIPQTRSQSKKVQTADCGLADPNLQTPMPESEAGSEFGPPPPDTTPGPLRGNS